MSPRGGDAPPAVLMVLPFVPDAVQQQSACCAMAFISNIIMIGMALLSECPGSFAPLNGNFTHVVWSWMLVGISSLHCQSQLPT